MDGRNTGRMGFSHAAEDSAENMMAAVKAGKIRKHVMGKTRDDRIYRLCPDETLL